jgi:prepilin-type N-terminal cleavage/methylation domain-containing protein
MSGISRMTGKNQRGYTLVEMLIALAILGIIAPVLGVSVFQVVSANELAGKHMTAVKQVESAVYWISHDTQMAQTVETSGGSGFPLSLTWIEWDNTSNNVTYTIQNGELQRARSVDGGEPTVTTIAWHINEDVGMTNCQFDDGVLTIKITASLEGFRSASETRVSEIVPKPQ